MNHYDFATHFRAIYDHAVARHAAGATAATLFAPAQLAWLAANGLNAQTMFDYAEDDADGGEPGFERALLIEGVRRDYFLNAQGGRPAPRVLDETTLPPKDATVEGIAWLPRIIPKAKAKLRGELPASLMYSCGGDRRFFKTHDIHPAEFLSLVWRHEADDAAIVAWVVRRSRAGK